MRPPEFLPPANSKTWHNRRWRDGLGYFRVRSLARTGYRDAPMVRNHLLGLRAQAAKEGQERLRDLIDKALSAANAFVAEASDQRWHEVIAAVDAVLLEQERLKQQDT